jgi:hypothetical protein
MSLTVDEQNRLDAAKLAAIQEWLSKHSEVCTMLSRLFSSMTTLELLWNLREYGNGANFEITENHLANSGVAFSVEELQASMSTIESILQSAQPWMPVIAKVAKI